MYFEVTKLVTVITLVKKRLSEEKILLSIFRDRINQVEIISRYLCGKIVSLFPSKYPTGCNACIRFCESWRVDQKSSSRRDSTAFFFKTTSGTGSCEIERERERETGGGGRKRRWSASLVYEAVHGHHVSPIGKHSEEAYWQVVSAATNVWGPTRDVKTVHCKHRKRWRRGNQPSSRNRWPPRSFSSRHPLVSISSHREIRDNSHLCNWRKLYVCMYLYDTFHGIHSRIYRRSGCLREEERSETQPVAA